MAEGGSGGAADGVMRDAGQFSAIINAGREKMMADINAVGGLAIADALPTFNGGSGITHIDAQNITFKCNDLGLKDIDSPSINKEASINDGMNRRLDGGDSNGKTKCTIGRCPKMYEDLLCCSNCNRAIHNACAANMEKMNKDKDGKPLEPVEGFKFCTKRCYYIDKKVEMPPILGGLTMERKERTTLIPLNRSLYSGSANGRPLTDTGVAMGA